MIGVFGLSFIESIELFGSLAAVCLIGLGYFRTSGAKGRKGLVWERLREGIGVFSMGSIVAGKAQLASGVPSLKLEDGRELPIPSDLSDCYEMVEVPKALKIPRGSIPFFPVERNQVVKFNGSLVAEVEGVIAPNHLPKYAARSTLGKVLTWKGGVANWTMIILAAGMALVVGYIMYPQFNHPASIIEYCQRFTNGTVGACSVIP